MAREQRRLAAIVSIDVVGYSRLMAADESGTLSRLKALRRDAIDPSVAEFGGRIVKTTGDGFLLEFASVLDALQFAMHVQRAVAERSAALPPADRMEFRIGINIGDIILDGDDIFGDGVNVAARVQAEADPGSVFVSRVVRDQLVDKVAMRFEPLGARMLKNIAQPVEIFRVRPDTTATRAIGTRTTTPRRALLSRRTWIVGACVILVAGAIALALTDARRERHPPALSVVVLPLTATEASAADARLADELTQDLASELGRWRWAKVTSVRSDPDRATDLRTLGRQANARYVVNGQLRARGDGVVVAANLIETLAGTVVWSDRLEFDRASADDRTAAPARLSRRVRNALYDAEIRRAVANPSPRSAWDFVLRGDAAFGSGENLDNVRAARELYDQALRLDPEFVPALISVSTAITAAMNNFRRDPALLARQVAELDAVTRRAIEIDPQDASAWLRRSIALNSLGRPGEAIAANVKAETLDASNPSYVVHHALLALVLGRPEEALSLAQRALRMERGLLAEEGVSLRMVCECQLMLGRYDAAVRDCQQAAARSDTWYEHALLAAAYAQMNDAVAAETSRRVVVKEQPAITIERLASFESSPSDAPSYRELRQRHFYDGLRKAGLPER